jgi:hypothetical protein
MSKTMTVMKSSATDDLGEVPDFLGRPLYNVTQPPPETPPGVNSSRPLNPLRQPRPSPLSLINPHHNIPSWKAEEKKLKRT